MNGKDKQAEIKASQRTQEKLRKDAVDYIVNNFGKEKVNETNIEKLMLYNETNGHCIYCNKPININELMIVGYEIEHILPYSKSFDDSFYNKTIACRKCNDEKKNQTPYQFLNKNNEYADFKERINRLEISSNKKQNLLFENDINKYTTRFFHRNLRDTAYATKELVRQINLFNYYLETLFNDTKINTLSIPGQLTHKMRTQYDLEKNRDIGNFHHAVDASILVSIANTEFGKILIDSQNNPKFWKEIDKNIHETFNKFQKVEINDTIGTIKNINEDNTLQSYQINKNPQKQLSHANVYKVIQKEEKYYRIDQISDIYDSNIDMKFLEQLFLYPTNNETLLCYDKNRNQFEFLKEIYLKYKSEKGNPFVNYCIEINNIEDKKHFEYLKDGIRFPDKEKSPIIKTLRYYTTFNDPFFLEKDNIKKKSSTKIALNSIAQYCVRIYVDIDKNKFLFLPVYSVSTDLKTKKINEDNLLYKRLKEKYIGNAKVEHLIDLFNGDYIEVAKKNNEIVSGCYSTYNKALDKIILKNNNYFTKSDLGIKVFSIDILGKKYCRLTKYLN